MDGSCKDQTYHGGVIHPAAFPHVAIDLDELVRLYIALIAVCRLLASPPDSYPAPAGRAHPTAKRASPRMESEGTKTETIKQSRIWIASPSYPSRTCRAKNTENDSIKLIGAGHHAADL